MSQLATSSPTLIVSPTSPDSPTSSGSPTSTDLSSGSDTQRRNQTLPDHPGSRQIGSHHTGPHHAGSHHSSHHTESNQIGSYYAGSHQTVPEQAAPGRSRSDPDLESPVDQPRSPKALARIARHLAGQVELWRPLLHVDPDQRWYTRLTAGDGWEAWLLTWLPGQGTDLHDHGGSSGAFTVLSGELQELVPAPTNAEPARLSSRVLRAPQVRAFGPSHIHQVIGIGDTPAASLHVYGPALTVMNRYTLDHELGAILAATERAGQDW